MSPNVFLEVFQLIWMFPLKEKLNLPNTIKQPLLSVNTETFHITRNFQALNKYTDGCDKWTVFTMKCVYSQLFEVVRCLAQEMQVYI
jgi:BioD-like phosphotransacetylase family protein